MTTSAAGTGMPASARSLRDWYSWIFMSPGRIPVGGGKLKRTWGGRCRAGRVKGVKGAFERGATHRGNVISDEEGEARDEDHHPRRLRTSRHDPGAGTSRRGA